MREGGGEERNGRPRSGARAGEGRGAAGSARASAAARRRARWRAFGRERSIARRHHTRALCGRAVTRTPGPWIPMERGARSSERRPHKATDALEWLGVSGSDGPAIGSDETLNPEQAVLQLLYYNNRSSHRASILSVSRRKSRR